MAEVHNKARNAAQGTKGKAKEAAGRGDWQRQTQSQGQDRSGQIESQEGW